ncbi:P-loop containing nucleoside triphosphate hydrolase protein [Xylariaceae sp. FL1651]|nr:P-loop containing nucleoside triphosphate hydrolase protein [Xylariaceae sp. FL1651]
MSRSVSETDDWSSIAGPNQEAWTTTYSEVIITPQEPESGSGTPGAEPDATEEGINRTPKLPYFYQKLHLRNEKFCGREDAIKRIDEVFQPSGKSPNSEQAAIKVFSICGLGGMGKTQLALEYCFRRQDDFDAVFWLSADESVKMDESFAEIAYELNLLTQQESKNRVVSRNAVLGWLSRPRKTQVGADLGEAAQESLARWLMILDNLDNPSQSRDYTPLHGNGAILITSRDPFSKKYLFDGEGIDLEPFNVEDAQQFLQIATYQSQSQEDDKDCLSLCERLGGMPLAIAHVAGVINGHDLTFSECLEAYEKGLLIHRTEELALTQVGTYNRTLSTVFALERLTPPALQLLELISCFDPDIIQESFIAQNADAIPIEDHPSSDQYTNARSELVRASLVKRNKADKTLSTHRVVQDVVRDRLSSTKFCSVFAHAASLIAAAWVEDRESLFSLSLEDWKRASGVVPHILKMFAHFRDRKPQLGDGELYQFASLVNRTIIYIKERQDYITFFAIAQQFIEMIQPRSEGFMAELYADVLMSLASASNNLGDRELGLKYSIEHFKQRLFVEDAKKQDGSYKERAMAYTELAAARLQYNDYHEVVELSKIGRRLLEKYPKYLEDTYWPHWADYFHAYGLIGLGRYDEALSIVLATLQWRQRHYGKDDTESMKTAYGLHMLGLIKDKLGQRDEAIPAYEKSLKLFILTDGDSSWGANRVRVKLGEHYTRLRKPGPARLMFDMALDYFNGAPFWKRERARILFQKSKLLRSLGDERLALEAINEAEKLYDELNPDQREAGTGVSEDEFEMLVMPQSR